MKILTSIIAVWFACFGIQTASASFFVDFYLSAPRVQSSFAQGNAGTATEDYNNLSLGGHSGPGTLGVGNYTGSFQVVAADQWGGANSSKYPTNPSGFDLCLREAPSDRQNYSDHQRLKITDAAVDALLETNQKSLL